jgi:hypothetical protein
MHEKVNFSCLRRLPPYHLPDTRQQSMLPPVLILRMAGRFCARSCSSSNVHHISNRGISATARTSAGFLRGWGALKVQEGAGMGWHIRG